MTQTVSERDDTAGSARSLFDSTADLITAKGVVLLVFLTGITATSIVTREAVEGVLPGAVLAASLVIAVIYEDLRNETIDVVGIVGVALATVYTGMEYIRVTRQGLWFPLTAAFLLLATSGIVAWRADTDNAAEFVEKLDVVGLHGGILFVLYSLLFVGISTAEASTDEFLLSPVLPAVLLFFALSLLGTTVVYAARSSTVNVASNELHHRLVSVVRGLTEIDDEEDRESLGQHVRSVAQALTGVRLPTRVGISDGRVPVVLPVSEEPVFKAEDLDALLSGTDEKDITGYAVSDDGSAILFKNGETAVYYIAPKDQFGTNPDVLPYGYFGDARVYASPYSFVDSVEAVLTKTTAGETEEISQEAVGTTEESREDTDKAYDSHDGNVVPDEIEAEAEEIAEEKGVEDMFSDEEAAAEDGDEISEEADDEGDETENETETTFDNETDINKKLDDTGDLFD